MTALAANATRKLVAMTHKQFTLKSGSIAYKGARAAIDLATGKVVPASASALQFTIGIFDEYVDASSADKLVNVNFEKEILASWWVNGATTDACAATDIGKPAYSLDDQTVSINPSGKSLAGTIYGFDSTKGVLVAKVEHTPNPFAKVIALAAFAAGDVAPASLEHGAIYDVNTTAANSTVTLPAAAKDGTIVYFAADGTKNGHTVQYRDATGPVNITAALTASKRHLVMCAKQGGLWFATALVSP